RPEVRFSADTKKARRAALKALLFSKTIPRFLSPSPAPPPAPPPPPPPPPLRSLFFHFIFFAQLVLNNFGASKEGGKVMGLMTNMLQNMFPAIDVQKVHLAEARRVVLLNYNAETGRIDFRHYGVSVRPVGISKSVKQIIAPGTMSSTANANYLPDLKGYADIADYVLREAAASESEAEDGDNTVELGQDYVGRGNRRAAQRAVKLTELGPRMELELTKIQLGLRRDDDGHEFESEPELEPGTGKVPRGRGQRDADVRLAADVAELAREAHPGRRRRRVGQVARVFGRGRG
ncbi:MAG: Brix domain-containing protein, partial [Olpidium bornovanus]